MSSSEENLRPRWSTGIFDALSATLLVSLLHGLYAGVARNELYVRQGFYLPTIDTLNVQLRKGLLAGALCFGLYLLTLALLRGRTSSRSTVLRSAATAAALPVLWYGVRRFGWSPRAALYFLGAWIVGGFLLGQWTRRRLLAGTKPGLRGTALALGLLALTTHVVGATARFLPKRRPNVLVIVIDCLRADHLSCYGYERETSPNLDAFAQDAVLFSQAISQSTYTKSSIASLFTSKNTHSHGVYYGSNKDVTGEVTSDVLSSDELTLAEELGQRGLFTAAWLNQSQLLAKMGFQQGFTIFENRRGSIHKIHASFMGWLNRLGRRTDFFVYLHYLDLHDPYSPPPPYDTLYGTYSDFYEHVDFDLMSWGRFHEEIRSGERVLRPEDIDQLRASYDGLVSFIDEALGQLFDQLRASDVYDDSIIVVTSDHGDGFMEHGFLAHSAAPYEELVRVPLLIKLPGSRHAGRRIDRQVRLVDVMPTILDSVGPDSEVPWRGAGDGVSLLPLLEEQAAVFPRYAISEIGEDLSEHSIAVRSGTHKLVYFPADGRSELYDLEADPGERVDLAAREPAVADELRRLALAAYQEGRARVTGKVGLDEETLEELRALGYVR